MAAGCLAQWFPARKQSGGEDPRSGNRQQMLRRGVPLRVAPKQRGKRPAWSFFVEDEVRLRR
eukprot:2953175-Alexandrium_andersonii.AAC.1